MVIHPCIQIKPVECDARCAHRDFNEIRSGVPLENRGANTEIRRRLSGTQKAREEDRKHVEGSVETFPAILKDATEIPEGRFRGACSPDDFPLTQ